MAHTYAHLFGMTLVGLRFFTVYGPWGRPDMAMWIFAERIAAGEPIPVFNHGRMRRDFTFVDDIVGGTAAVLFAPGLAGHEVFNIGAGRCVELGAMIATLEAAIGKRAVLDPRPLQPGDVLATWADVSKLRAVTGYEPGTPIDVGIPEFVKWYLDHPDLAAMVRRERESSAT
jgi:UDP-glucuronate 4-epimerase